MTNPSLISISESRSIPLSMLEVNSGQIEGLPANPRFVTGKDFQNLKKSIKRNPELLSYRELLVFPYAKNKFVIIGGNTRYKALCDLGYTEAPCKVLDANTPIVKLKRYILLDNHNNGKWDKDILSEGWEFLELEDIGLDMDFSKFAEDEETPEEGTKEVDDDKDAEDDEDEKESFYQSMLTDCLYESNNIYDIPTLRKDMQAGKVILPLAPYGADSRLRKDIGTYHFYVDDYRFEAIWKDPIKVLMSGCQAIVEPNLSLFDTTPIAYGLQQIYKKRWIARYFQDCGIKVFADLNVSRKFQEYNRMGIPDGYNAFFTRGYTDRITHLDEELEIAKKISGLDAPNLIIYGGGAKVHEYCAKHNLVYVEQFMQFKKNGKK